MDRTRCHGTGIESYESNTSDLPDDLDDGEDGNRTDNARIGPSSSQYGWPATVRLIIGTDSWPTGTGGYHR